MAMKIAKECILKFNQMLFTVSISEFAGQVYLLISLFHFIFLRIMRSKSLGETKVSILLLQKYNGIVGKQKYLKKAFDFLFS